MEPRLNAISYALDGLLLIFLAASRSWGEGLTVPRLNACGLADETAEGRLSLSAEVSGIPLNATF